MPAWEVPWPGNRKATAGRPARTSIAEETIAPASFDEQRRGIGTALGHHERTQRQGLASTLQRVGDVRERRLRHRQVLPELLRARSQRLRAARRQRQHAPPRGSELGHSVRGRAQYGVRVRAPDAEGTHSRDPPGGTLRPGLPGCWNLEADALEIEARVGSVEVRERRDFRRLQRAHGLDQPGDTGRHVEVADIGLDGAEPATLQARLAGAAQYHVERRDLERIADGRARAVGFYVLDVGRIDRRQRERAADHRALPFDRRRGVIHLRAAVIVDRGGEDHRAESGRDPRALRPAA